MIKFMIICLWVLIFSFGIIKTILIVRKNSLEGKPLLDGLNKQKKHEFLSSGSSITETIRQENAGILTTNISGTNPNCRKR